MDKTLVLAGARPKRIRLRIVDDTTLEQTTWNAKGVPKPTRKIFTDTQEAARAFDDAVRKKLRADYAYVAEPNAYGDVILEAFAPGAGSGNVLDMSIDGMRVATRRRRAAALASA